MELKLESCPWQGLLAYETLSEKMEKQYTENFIVSGKRNLDSESELQDEDSNPFLSQFMKQFWRGLPD